VPHPNINLELFQTISVVSEFPSQNRRQNKKVFPQNRSLKFLNSKHVNQYIFHKQKSNFKSFTMLTITGG